MRNWYILLYILAVIAIACTIAFLGLMNPYTILLLSLIFLFFFVKNKNFPILLISFYIFAITMFFCFELYEKTVETLFELGSVQVHITDIIMILFLALFCHKMLGKDPRFKKNIYINRKIILCFLLYYFVIFFNRLRVIDVSSAQKVLRNTANNFFPLFILFPIILLIDSDYKMKIFLKGVLYSSLILGVLLIQDRFSGGMEAGFGFITRWTTTHRGMIFFYAILILLSQKYLVRNIMLKYSVLFIYILNIVVTYKRSIFIAMAVALVFLVFKLKKTKYWIVYISMAFLPFLFFGDYIPIIINKLVGRFLLMENIYYGTMGVRLMRWKYALEHFRENPIIGHGFRGVYGREIVIGESSGLFAGTAHNVFIEHLCSYGILGIILLIIPIAWGYFLKKNPRDKFLSELNIINKSYILFSVILFFFNTSAIAIYLFTIIALQFSLRNISIVNKNSE